MPDMKLFLELIAKSERFQSGVQAGENALKGFRGFVGKTAQDVEYLTKKIGVFGQASAALSSGLVLKKLFSLEDWKPIDDALLRTQVNLKATGDQMDAFKKKIAGIAGETGLDQGEAFQSAYKLSFAFNPDEIETIMKASEKAANAMKAPYDAVQDRIVQIMKLNRLSAKDVGGISDALIASKLDVESLDIVLQRLALRGGTAKDYTQTLGMLLGMKKGGITSGRSVVQLNEVLGGIENKAQILEKSGIKVRNVKKDGTVEWRDQLAVLKDLEAYIKRWEKSTPATVIDERLNRLFGDGARQKLNFIFSQTENFKKGMDDMANASVIAAQRSAAAEQTWEKQLSKIKSTLSSIKTDFSFIYDLAKKPVKFLADSPHLTKAAGYTAAGLSMAVLAALGASKAHEIFKGLGKTGVGIASGKAIEAATGVTPVYITNWPAGILGPGTLPGPAGKLATAAKWAAGASGSFAVGWGIGSLMNDGVNNFTSMMTNGAYKGEGALGELLYDYVHGSMKEIKNEIKIDLKVDAFGRIISQSDDPNTSLALTMYRGTF